LTANQKQQHVIVFKELHKLTSVDPPFLSMVIIGDESQIYDYHHEKNRQSSEWKDPNSPRLEEARQVTSRRLFTKNSSWQARQSILHTTAMFYGDCVKMCEDFTLNCDEI
jgi:hypothetical protein